VEAAAGAPITLTEHAEDGYMLKAGTLKYGVVLNGPNDPLSYASIDELTKEFLLPAQNVTVVAEFEPVPPPYTLVENQLDTPTDLKLRFDITATGTEGVSAVFTALHNLIATPIGNDSFADIIKLGDWVDLPSLQVVGYPEDDLDIAGPGPSDPSVGGRYGKIDIASNTTWGGNHGELLRLIVVGINSFNEIIDVGNATDNEHNQATPHVVFQFQNFPGTHRMEATNINTNGYLGSEMRAYLIGNFLTGLQNAGVPDAVLWAPSRRVANKGSGADAADIIADTLWLPTEWEMFGPNTGANSYSNATYENSTNQASFAGFYTTPVARTKYKASNQAEYYWLASPSSSSTGNFCGVNNSGAAYNLGAASHVRGITPAFCVK
jgi:hypothetical protein